MSDPIFTYCQRLCPSDKIGFEYEYMGAAEYEFGATREARKDLHNASALITKDLDIHVKPVFEKAKTMKMTALFSKADEEEAIAMLEAIQAGTNINKMSMHSSTVIGWLVVDPVPALIYTRNKDGIKRAEQFTEHFKQHIEDLK